MSAKLDMALDDVVMTERTARRRGRGGRRAPTAGRKATAPVGGIQKNTKATKGPMKPVIPNGLASGGRESKIIVSNLPADVTEKNVKHSISLDYNWHSLNILHILYQRVPSSMPSNRHPFFADRHTTLINFRHLLHTTLVLLRTVTGSVLEARANNEVRKPHTTGQTLGSLIYGISRVENFACCILEYYIRGSHSMACLHYLDGFLKAGYFNWTLEYHHLDNDYFSDTIGPVKRVTISYGPNGVNKGIVTIIFAKPDSAAKALETLNGVQVDKRPMKIEVVLDAAKAVAAAPSKGLSDRITPGKGPKPATAAKTATDGTATRGRGGRGRATGRRGRNAGRGKPKTADELDAEMVDYFDPSNTNGAVTEGSGAAAVTANGATQPAATLEDAGMDEISSALYFGRSPSTSTLAPPSLRARAQSRPQNSYSLFRYLFPQTTKRARDRLSVFRHESIPRYRHQAQSRIYQLILKRQARKRERRADGGGFWSRLFSRRRLSRLAAIDHVPRSIRAPTRQKVMSQAGSDSEATFGRGTRRRKLAGLLKSANELRQSYQQSYGLGPQRDGGGDYDESEIPGAFPDVAIARSADEEMLLFPSYARRHSPRKAGNQDLPGSLHDTREQERPHSTGYVQQEWDRYEETNSIVEVDVRGWVYSPQKGQLSRYNRAMIALARRMSGIPAPSSSRASSPNSSHHLRVEARAARHEQELVDKEAESIKRKGEGERHVALHGGYSEAPGRRVHKASSQNASMGSRTPSPRHPEDLTSGKPNDPLEKTSAYEDGDDAPEPGSLAKRASWNQPADMSSAELSVANAHMMLRLRPFLTTPLTSTPLTVFFYNEKTSRSRTTYTNEAGHFQLRAALDFVPTNVRVLASETLSATEDVLVTEPHGVSLISDVDDTIKHSAIGAGAREVFRNVFIRDLSDLRIDGVKEWYAKMASMGVQMHYVSNMPWQLFPVLSSFLSGAGLPKGSFHLKHYTGMLQGIFEPVAERKKGTLERIMSDFPQRRFILVGDSGEADLELYTDIVEANPGRVLGVFIRDVTTKPSQGFFDPATNGERASRSTNRSSVENRSTRSSDASTNLPNHFEPRPKLPPRQQTRSSSTLNKAPPAPPMGQLIDYEDDETPPPHMKRSMTDNEIPRFNHTNHTLPPRIQPKPSSLRSLHHDRKPAPPRPPKPRQL
ncbi:MAG: hypothetical protein Q9210_002852, partial [Variospora velana]